MKPRVLMVLLTVFSLLVLAACGGDDGGTTGTTGVDTTAPLFTSAPALSGTPTQTTATIVFTLDEDATVFYLELPDGAAAPGAGAVKSAAQSINATGGVQASLNLSGLAPGTSYDYYLVAEDASSNLQSVPSKVDITTAAADDTTPPVFTVAPALNGIPGAMSAEIVLTVNEGANVYYMVLESSMEEPSATVVKASNTKITASAGVQAAIALSGLSASTSYDVWIVAEDGNGNLQAAPVKVTLTTSAGPSSDAELSGLTVSPTNISAFAPGTTDYAVSVANAVAQVSITATRSHSGASLKIAGAAATSGEARQVNVAVGLTNIQIEVTAEDGTTKKTYTIAVTRAADTTAPVFTSAPAVSGSPGTTNAVIVLTTDENATVYFELYGSPSSAPGPATVKTFGDARSATGGVQLSFNRAGLTAGTAYDLYIVAEDGSGNLQSTVTKVTFTTASGGGPVSMVINYTFESINTPVATDPASVSAGAFVASGSRTLTYSASSTGNGQAISASQWSTNTTLSTYWEFTVSGSGTTISPTNISWIYRNSATGPKNWLLRTSADGFSSDIATGSLNVDTLWYVQSANLSAVPSQSETVTIRIYGYNAGGTAGTFRVDNLVLAGTVVD